jgi:hypothetical protein
MASIVRCACLRKTATDPDARLFRPIRFTELARTDLR